MTTPNKIYEGIAIIAKYNSGEMDDDCFQAEHDQIWCTTCAEMEPDDSARMDELGWFEDEDSWSMFT